MMSINRGMRLGVGFLTRKRKKKKKKSARSDDDTDDGSRPLLKKIKEQVKDDDDSKGLRLHKCSSGPIKRKKKQQQHQQEIKNNFGTNIYQCSGLNHRDTNYNYQDSDSLILKTWSDHLRGPRKNIDLIKEEEKKKKKFKARKTTRGFMLRKCSTRIQKGRLKVGDRVNVSQILFNKHRDFLITYKDRDRPVQPKHLKGKVVILHFVPLEPWDYVLMRWVTSLVDIYNELHPQGVEVVFIGVNTQESHELSLHECFEEKFSIMPWTAIPFPDIMKSQRHLEKKLRLNFSKYVTGSQTVSLVIDPAGVVLQLNAAEYIAEYGARAFPFNEERIQLLRYEEEEALKHPSITKLLTTPQCNYVINPRNQAVPVRDLEDKVVALYFYENYELNDLTEELKRAYKQLASKGNFEIVLVYIHDSVDAYDLESQESFWETFQTMPWLALPYKDPRSKYLKRMFSYPLTLDGPGPDPRLLVIGPQGKFVEPYGVDILQKFGISAYPFSRKRVAEVEAAYIRKLKLDMILDRDTIFIQKDGHKVKLSQLVGKKIIFMIDDGWATVHTSFCRRLKERYIQMKDTDDEFEVIHVPYKYKNSSLGEYIATMPWLTSSPFRLENKHYLRRIFRRGVGLLAFNGNGRVVRRAMFPSLERGNMEFPFYAGSLEEEAFTELISYFNWDSWLRRVPSD